MTNPQGNHLRKMNVYMNKEMKQQHNGTLEKIS